MTSDLDVLIRTCYNLKKDIDTTTSLSNKTKDQVLTLMKDMSKHSIKEGELTITATVVTPTCADLDACSKIDRWTELQEEETKLSTHIKLLAFERKLIESKYKIDRKPYLKLTTK